MSYKKNARDNRRDKRGSADPNRVDQLLREARTNSTGVNKADEAKAQKQANRAAWEAEKVQQRQAERKSGVTKADDVGNIAVEPAMSSEPTADTIEQVMVGQSPVEQETPGNKARSRRKHALTKDAVHAAYIITHGPIWLMLSRAFWPRENESVLFRIKRVGYDADGKAIAYDAETNLRILLDGMVHHPGNPNALHISGRILLATASDELSPYYPNGKPFKSDAKIELYYDLETRSGIICNLAGFSIRSAEDSTAPTESRPFIPADYAAKFGL